MARATHQIVTASDLQTGEVVYLTAADQWSARMCDAQVMDAADAAQQRLEWANGQQALIVGPYLASVQLVDGQPGPDHFREAFRATGPSNRFHGKQERA